jgi:hypothetical protein
MADVRLASASSGLLAFAVVALVPALARADDSTFDPSKVAYVEDPFAPHNTSGMTARVGTAIGYFDGQLQDVLAIGAVAAIGERFGRLTIEVEAAMMSLDSTTANNATIGDAERLGVIGRFDVIRLGPHIVGPNSMVSLYVEGGAERAWNHWYRPNANSSSLQSNPEAMQMVPDDSANVEGVFGFGILLDHRLQEPITFPHRIGWFLGWRMAYAPHGAEVGVMCLGTSCKPAPTTPDDTYVDRSMLFQSSLAVTW